MEVRWFLQEFTKILNAHAREWNTICNSRQPHTHKFFYNVSHNNTGMIISFTQNLKPTASYPFW